jgi:hypothetical protein
LRDGDVRASPRGANYTFYPGSGLWAGMIGTTNNGYITAFQWLFSQASDFKGIVPLSW